MAWKQLVRPPTVVTPKKDKAIIVVDDSAVIKTFIQKIFDNEFDVLMASDGNEALQLIHQTEQT